MYINLVPHSILPSQFNSSTAYFLSSFQKKDSAFLQSKKISMLVLKYVC